MKFKIFRYAFLLLTICLIFLSFSACSGTTFKDKALGEVFGEAFDKNPRNVTVEELASIESFSIILYPETNYVTIKFAGYDEVFESQGKDAASDYIRTVDVTDKSFSTLEDFVYLKNLSYFSATYAPFNSFEFLTNCSNLREIEISSCYNCSDYSYLNSLENLKRLSISESEFTDLSFISKMKNLTSLSLNGASKAGYPIHDISFVKDMISLKSLSISSSGITDISPLENLKNLEHLNLSYNGISDVTPISCLSNLKFINLTQNLVSDLSSLTNYDPDNFQRIILDLNSLIEDWSPLDYLGNKVQGRY